MTSYKPLHQAMVQVTYICIKVVTRWNCSM